MQDRLLAPMSGTLRAEHVVPFCETQWNVCLTPSGAGVQRHPRWPDEQNRQRLRKDLVPRLPIAAESINPLLLFAPTYSRNVPCRVERVVIVTRMHIF